MTIINSYRIIPDINLVIQFHKGNLTFQNAVNIKKQIAADPMFHPDYNFLIDLSRVDSFNMSANELQEYGNIVFEQVFSNTHSKMAAIVDSPQQTAKAMLFESFGHIHKNRFSSFSTFSVALSWLGIDASWLNFITDVISEMNL